MLLYPTRCVCCGQWIDRQKQGLCEACQKQLLHEMKQLYCPAPAQIERVICVGRYRDGLKRAIYRMKFQYGGQPVMLPLAKLMEQAWEANHMPRPDVITCVPVSPLRLRTRGYDQSAEMAKHLAKRWDIPFEPVLRRRMLSRKQSTLTAEQRWNHAKKSFYLSRNTCLNGKHILLVDDIITTGASVSCCAALLRQAGAQTVWALAVAKAGNC